MNKNFVKENYNDSPNRGRLRSGKVTKNYAPEKTNELVEEIPKSSNTLSLDPIVEQALKALDLDQYIESFVKEKLDSEAIVSYF